jgi:ATP-dependent Clp protease ATP-binding subunit ClpC
VLNHAHDIADELKEQQDSIHLLLSLFIADNRAKGFLEARGLNKDKLIPAVREVRSDKGFDEEPVDTIAVIHDKTIRLTERCGARVAGSLHLLGGILRVRRSAAYRVLTRMDTSPAALRNEVIRTLTSGSKEYRVQSATPHADRVQPTRTDGSIGLEAQGQVAVAEPEPEEEFEHRAAQEAEPEPEREVEGDRRRFGSAWLQLDIDADDDVVPEHPDDEAKSGRFSLNEETFPTLTRLGRNLTLAAECGQLDPLIGRETEVEQLVDILNKRRANNPCLVGEPGVGKTAIVEGLAQRIVSRDGRVGTLGDRVIIELDMGALVAGTQLRGAFSERLRMLKDEVSRADGRVVLFIDEIHTLIGAGAGEGALDAANDLKTALARGEFPCVGATTEREYRKHIESDPALARRFQTVLVDPPNESEALKVIVGLSPTYAAHHKVAYREEALQAAVRLSERWLQDRFLPAKAVDVLDLAGAFASRHSREYVSADDVAMVIASQAGIPRDRLLANERQRLLLMEGYLKDRVIAHDEAMAAIASTIRRNVAGFATKRPMGSFLLLGPTGVGKTEAARVLADFLFASRDALTRIDMSEYMEKYAVSRLIGAPPGYVGHDDGGQLTESVRRRPYQIILIDEVEKAAPDVLNILLQLLEEGELTDGRGRKVSFRHTVVIMTSNLGAQHFGAKARRRVGFGNAEAAHEGAAAAALETASKSFSPELWNRIDSKLVFEPLTRADMTRIAALLLAESTRRLEAERGIQFVTAEPVVEFLADQIGDQLDYGARPLRRLVQEHVESAIAELVLADDVSEGAVLSVTVEDETVVARYA